MSLRIESTVSIRRWLTQLVAFFVLASSASVYADPPGTLEILTTATIETRTVGEMEQLFAITERVMLNSRLYKFMNEAFPEQLVIPEDLRAQFDGKEKAEGLSTTQVMYILNIVRAYWRYLDEYEAKVNDDNFEKPEIKEYRKQIAKFIKDEISKKNLDAELAKLNRPTQPVHLKVAGQKVAYSGLETYINHPYLLEPDDENSQLGTPDDLQQVAIDFVKGAKTSIMSNVFEFNLPKLAQAFIDQKKKGLDVSAGVDKNTSELDERNKAVTKMLTDALGENFVLVDPTGLNHQKIIVRDWGTANAAILFLSGNFTQSCIGKEGDAVGLPENQRPKESIPNANHAIFMKGRLPALIAQYQLRKTLIHKLRGESKYPTDGSYLLEGEFISEMNMPGFVAIAFSPNGGMGNVNTDLLKQIILRSVGPIEFAQFAM